MARIQLPYGGPEAAFDPYDLVSHITASDLDYIIQGQDNCRLEKHSKPNSLDVWLRRNYTSRKDTKQAVNRLVQDLVATGLFTVEYGLRCPDSGRRCKGLRLTEIALDWWVSKTDTP